MRTSRIVVSFIPNHRNMLVIRMRLADGTQFFGLVDTGCETTFLDTNFAKQHKDLLTINKSKHKMQFNGFEAAAELPVITALADCTLVSSIGMKTPITMNFYLYDMSKVNASFGDKDHQDIKIDAMFGNDWLTRVNAEINYEYQVMTIDYDISGK